MTTTNTSRRPGVTGVHSINRFVFSVPDLDEAQRFYSHFGLDVRRVNGRLDLFAEGHPHRWASVFSSGKPKQLEYVSYGLFEEDLAAMRERVARLGRACRTHCRTAAACGCATLTARRCNSSLQPRSRPVPNVVPRLRLQ